VTGRYWQGGVTAAEFNALRDDPRLPLLFALARLSNAMSLAHHGFGTPLKWQSPRAIKERTSAFLYVAGMLHEGLILVESLGKYSTAKSLRRSWPTARFDDCEHGI